MPGKTWSEEELAVLKKLCGMFMKGVMSEQDICTVLGRTFHAVRHKAHEQGIKFSVQNNNKVDISKLRAILGKSGIKARGKTVAEMLEAL